jgi:hypothetical protein
MNDQEMNNGDNASRKRKDTVAGKRRNVVANRNQERAAQARVILDRVRIETNNRALGVWY